MGCLYVCLGMLCRYVSVRVWGQAVSTVRVTTINARELAVKNYNNRPHHGHKVLRRSPDRENTNVTQTSCPSSTALPQSRHSAAQFFADSAAFIEVL